MPGCFVCGKEQPVLKSKTCTVGISRLKDGKQVIEKDTGSYALCDDCESRENLIKK